MHGHLWLAELLLVINFFNLSFAYFYHSSELGKIHVGPIVGPLVWNFTALYWMGAKAVDLTNPAARILAYVSIWGWLGYGLFYLTVYKDYIIGIALSVLALCKSLPCHALQTTNCLQPLVLVSTLRIPPLHTYKVHSLSLLEAF